jgi:hypothetical protein
MVLSKRNRNIENLRRIAMKLILTLFISFAVMLVLAGCASTVPQPMSGVVGYSKNYLLGTRAADIPFVSIDGKQTSFEKVSQPIAIIAFTSAPGEACCRLVPELVTLAHYYRNEPITMAQISLPTTKCPHGPGCAEYCNINDAHLVSLCDVDRIAWKAYLQPEPNTVFLIDDIYKIIAIESMTNIESITQKAQRLAYELEEIDISLY